MSGSSSWSLGRRETFFDFLGAEQTSICYAHMSLAKCMFHEFLDSWSYLCANHPQKLADVCPWSPRNGNAPTGSACLCIEWFNNPGLSMQLDHLHNEVSTAGESTQNLVEKSALEQAHRLGIPDSRTHRGTPSFLPRQQAMLSRRSLYGNLAQRIWAQFSGPERSLTLTCGHRRLC